MPTTVSHLRIVPACILVVLCVSCSPKSLERDADPNVPSFDAREGTAALQRSCPETEARQECLEKGIIALTETIGPEAAVASLLELLASDLPLARKDYHDLVHRIGRATAKKFGVSPQNFARCPLDFNYGCPHGFFEQALVEEPDARAAALKICDPAYLASKPRKSHFYCYHGVGHGIMMAKAYRLGESLALCDSFPEGAAIEGCWQGVFMENVNGVMTGILKEHRFSDMDLLAPCSTLDERYRWECYINHAGYLVPKSGHSVEKATQECLREETNAKHACLQSIGLMATNPSWQLSLVGEDLGSVPRNAAHICSRFPKGFDEDCIGAAVDNLANFDRTDTSRARAFCALLPENLMSMCYQTLGNAFRNEIPASEPADGICDGVPEEYRPHCLKSL